MGNYHLSSDFGVVNAGVSPAMVLSAGKDVPLMEMSLLQRLAGSILRGIRRCFMGQEMPNPNDVLVPW